MREILACPCICINSRIFFTAYHDIQLGNQALVQPAFELDVSWTFWHLVDVQMVWNDKLARLGYICDASSLRCDVPKSRSPGVMQRLFSFFPNSILANLFIS